VALIARSGALLSLLTAFTAAQAPVFVSPAFYASLDGNAGTTWPFSADNSGSFESGIRLLQVHADARGSAMVLQSLALRADLADGALMGSATTLDLELGIGEGDLATIAPVFANNFIGGRTVAMSRRLVNIPQRTGLTADFVGPFDVVLPFDQPFTFSGANDLVWDLVNATPTATRRNGSFNDLAVPTNGWVGSVGAGTAVRGSSHCAPWSFFANAATTDAFGGQVMLSLGVGGTPGNFAAIGVGATDPAVPYPFGLCNQLIHTDALIILGGVIPPSGSFALTTTLPFAPHWADMLLTTQGFVYWPGQAQAWLSAGRRLRLPPGLPPTLMARIVYGTGPSPTVGIVQNPGVQLVVGFGN
jgi:hypothetical protein